MADLTEREQVRERILQSPQTECAGVAERVDLNATLLIAVDFAITLPEAPGSGLA